LIVISIGSLIGGRVNRILSLRLVLVFLVIGIGKVAIKDDANLKRDFGNGGGLGEVSPLGLEAFFFLSGLG